MRKILILIGILLYLVLFYILYKHQLGSIGFFLLSLLFFKLAKNKQAKQKNNHKRAGKLLFQRKVK